MRKKEQPIVPLIVLKMMDEAISQEEASVLHKYRTAVTPS
uniref:RPB5 homolog n=1 Tax=Schistosoma curassoni TaxID=6186 RepID=A0A183KAC7_9TREM